MVTKHQETITAPSWEEAVSVLELLVTRLGILEDDIKQLVHDHLQVRELGEGDKYLFIIFMI